MVWASLGWWVSHSWAGFFVSVGHSPGSACPVAATASRALSRTEVRSRFVTR